MGEPPTLAYRHRSTRGRRRRGLPPQPSSKGWRRRPRKQGIEVSRPQEGDNQRRVSGPGDRLAAQPDNPSLFEGDSSPRKAWLGDRRKAGKAERRSCPRNSARAAPAEAEGGLGRECYGSKERPPNPPHGACRGTLRKCHLILEPARYPRPHVVGHKALNRAYQRRDQEDAGPRRIISRSRRRSQLWGEEIHSAAYRRRGLPSCRHHFARTARCTSIC
jgi:hypothetical protein